MFKFNLTNVYAFFGGFAETITVTALVCGIVLAFLHMLTAEYAGMITAVGGSAIAHDQLTQWNNRKDENGSGNNQPAGN